MRLKQLKVCNYKTFSDVNITFSKMNLIIGSNNAGKTNLFSFFEFIQDLFEHGLNETILKHGGKKKILNQNEIKNDILSFVIVCELNHEKEYFPFLLNKNVTKEIHLIYTLKLKFKNQNKCKKLFEKLEIQWDFMHKNNIRNNLVKKVEPKNVCQIFYDFNHEKYVFEYNHHLRNMNEEQLSFLKQYLSSFSLNHRSLYGSNTQNIILFSHEVLQLLFQNAKNMFKIGVFNFNPVLMKQSKFFSQNILLEKTGGNLSKVLNQLFKDKQKTIDYFRYAQSFMPQIRELKTKILNQKERSVCFDDVSQGTLNLLALVYSLYFEKKTILCYETLETNIHPSLLTRIAERLYEKSNESQLFMITHNPHFVDLIPVEMIILIKRDVKGSSTIIQNLDSQKSIKPFLDNDLSLSDLMVDSFL